MKDLKGYIRKVEQHGSPSYDPVPMTLGDLWRYQHWLLRQWSSADDLAVRAVEGLGLTQRPRYTGRMGSFLCCRKKMTMRAKEYDGMPPSAWQSM